MSHGSTCRSRLRCEAQWPSHRPSIWFGKTKDAANASWQTLKCSMISTNTWPLKTLWQTSSKWRRVEPETLIDQSCLHIEYFCQISQTTLNIFFFFFFFHRLLFYQTLSLVGTINSTSDSYTGCSESPALISSMESYSEALISVLLTQSFVCLVPIVLLLWRIISSSC